jgi:hypothetical protein
MLSRRNLKFRWISGLTIDQKFPETHFGIIFGCGRDLVKGGVEP